MRVANDTFYSNYECEWVNKPTATWSGWLWRRLRSEFDVERDVTGASDACRWDTGSTHVTTLSNSVNISQSQYPISLSGTAGKLASKSRPQKVDTSGGQPTYTARHFDGGSHRCSNFSLADDNFKIWKTKKYKTENDWSTKN